MEVTTSFSMLDINFLVVRTAERRTTIHVILHLSSRDLTQMQTIVSVLSGGDQKDLCV